MKIQDHDNAVPKVYLYKRIVQAKVFIDQNYSEAIDLANIADEACFSKFHFLRVFKSLYGRSPHQYLIYVRIEKAKQFLSRETPVNETCFRVGFESVPSFILLFRKLTGLTPAVYQKQSLERNKKIAAEPLKFVPHCFANAFGYV